MSDYYPPSTSTKKNIRSSVRSSSVQSLVLGTVLGFFANSFCSNFILKRILFRGYNEPPKELIVTDKSGKKKLIRRLEKSDYEKGFVDLLKQLTVAPKMSKRKFARRWQQMRNGPEFTYVLESTTTDDDNDDDNNINNEKRIIATATLVIERKYGRNLGVCAHIEDVVVDENFRDEGLGKVMIDAMSIVARNHVGCYKTILDCSAENVQFYEKCGFNAKEIQMAKYFTDDRGFGAAAKKNVGIVKSGNGIINSERTKAGVRRQVKYAAGTGDFVGSPTKALLNQTVYYSDDE
jgi:glucosamine-phosphate N-acetyltransferase